MTGIVKSGILVAQSSAGAIHKFEATQHGVLCGAREEPQRHAVTLTRPAGLARANRTPPTHRGSITCMRLVFPRKLHLDFEIGAEDAGLSVVSRSLMSLPVTGRSESIQWVHWPLGAIVCLRPPNPVCFRCHGKIHDPGQTPSDSNLVTWPFPGF